MTRASNVANLTTAMLLQFDPNSRQNVLESIAGFNWTSDVLNVARNFPGNTGVTEGVRMSLSLHFLLGILDAEAGNNTPNARAYLAFARIFKDSQDRRKGLSAQASEGKIAGLGGLGSLGALGDMVDDQKWCDANVGKVFPASELNICKRCPQPGSVGRNSWNYWRGVTGTYECLADHPKTETGRRARGMSVPWSQPAPPAGFPAPPDIASVDFAQWKEFCGCCGLGTSGTKEVQRERGVRTLFRKVFGREPNKAEVTYYGSMKWCVEPNGNGVTMEQSMREVAKAINEKRASNTTPNPVEGGVVGPGQFTARKNPIEAAADAAFDLVGKSADFIINTVCGAFKQLLGPVVGGAICEVVTLLVNSYALLYQAVVVIVREAFSGIVESLKSIAAGKWEEAMLSLLRAVGRMLFALSAPVSVPLFMGRNVSREQGFKDLMDKADRVTKKNPLFPVTLVIAIVQLTGGPSVQVISGIVLSISPMIAVFVAPALLANTQVKQMSGITVVDTMEQAIENIIKMLVIVVQGLMKLPELIPKIRGQLGAVMQKRLGRGAAGIADTVGTTIRAFEAGFKAVNDAISKFQFQQITAAAVQLLNVVPLMLSAFVGPEEMAAGAAPSITDWMTANEATGRSVDMQQAALRDASLQFLKKLPFPQAMLVAVDRSMQENDLRERAKLVALIVGKTRLANKPGFEATFIPAFRAELIKVN
jgi:hypothetical protein